MPRKASLIRPRNPESKQKTRKAVKERNTNERISERRESLQTSLWLLRQDIYRIGVTLFRRVCYSVDKKFWLGMEVLNRRGEWCTGGRAEGAVGQRKVQWVEKASERVKERQRGWEGRGGGGVESTLSWRDIGFGVTSHCQYAVFHSAGTVYLISRRSLSELCREFSKRERAARFLHPSLLQAYFSPLYLPCVSDVSQS